VVRGNLRFFHHKDLSVGQPADIICLSLE